MSEEGIIITEGEILPPEPPPNATEVLKAADMLESVQVKFPRSKKKRIRKKWAKNQNNFTVRGAYFDMDNRFAAEIRKAFGDPQIKLEVGSKLELYGRQNQSQS